MEHGMRLEIIDVQKSNSEAVNINVHNYWLTLTYGRGSESAVFTLPPVGPMQRAKYSNAIYTYYKTLVLTDGDFSIN